MFGIAQLHYVGGAKASIRKEPNFTTREDKSSPISQCSGLYAISYATHRHLHSSVRVPQMSTLTPTISEEKFGFDKWTEDGLLVASDGSDAPILVYGDQRPFPEPPR